MCPEFLECLPLISTRYGAPTPHRERGKDNRKKRECLLNYVFAVIANYIFPFLNEAMGSSLVKTNVFRSKGRSLPLPRFPRFYLGGTTEGTGRGGNRIIVIKIVATSLFKLQGLLPEPVLHALVIFKASAIGFLRLGIVGVSTASSVLPRQLS